MKLFASLVLLVSLATQSYASDMHMARSASSFPETMLKLQSTIKAEGYKVSRVQRIDIGLTAMGYKTDKYRVVFYGKAEENARLTNKYPFLIPYLPLKIAIFAEGEETLLVASSPMLLANQAAPELTPVLKSWEKDLENIIKEMRVISD
jgi:uncharacterized protein (DUF302 family)